MLDLLGSLVSGHFKRSEALEDHRLKKYIVDPNAKVYEMTDMFFGRMTIPAKKVTISEEVTTGFEWKLDKFPFEFLRTTVAFFREVVSEFQGDEAILQYWYNKETKQYEMICLKQETSRTRVRYEADLEKVQDDNWVWVFDIHSHNHMNAFFSPTDDANEQSTGLYGVVGRVTKEMPEFEFRFSVEGQFFELSMFDLFEKPERSDFHFQGATYPSEWLEIVRAGKKHQRSLAPMHDSWRPNETWNQRAELPFDFEEDWKNFQYWKDDMYSDASNLSVETFDAVEVEGRHETSRDISKMNSLAYEWSEALDLLAKTLGPEGLALYLRVADDLLSGVLMGDGDEELYRMDLKDVDLLEELTNIFLHYGEDLEEQATMADYMMSNSDLTSRFITLIETCGSILNTHVDEDGSIYEAVEEILNTIQRITRDGDYTMQMELSLEEWMNENEEEETENREEIAIVLKRLNQEMVESFSNPDRHNVDQVWMNFSEETTSRMQKVYKKKHAASQEENAILASLLEWTPGLEKTLTLRFEFLRFLRVNKDFIEAGGEFQNLLRSYLDGVLSKGYLREFDEMPSMCSLAKFNDLFLETSFDIDNVLKGNHARERLAGIDRLMELCQTCEHPHARKAALIVLKCLVSFVSHDVYFYDFKIIDFEDSFVPPPTRGGAEKPQESSFSETDFQAHLAKIMQRNREVEIVSETRDCPVDSTITPSDLQRLRPETHELLQRYDYWMSEHAKFLVVLSARDSLKMYKTLHLLFTESLTLDSEGLFDFTGMSIGQHLLKLDKTVSCDLKMHPDEFMHPMIRLFYAQTALLLERFDRIQEDEKQQKHVAEQIMSRMFEFVKEWSQREEISDARYEAKSKLPVRTDNLVKHEQECNCSTCLDRAAVRDVYRRHAMWRISIDKLSMHHNEEVVEGMTRIMTNTLASLLKKIKKNEDAFHLGKVDVCGNVTRSSRSYQSKENLETDVYFNEMFVAQEALLDGCTELMWVRGHESTTVETILQDLFEYYVHRSKSGRSSQEDETFSEVSNPLDGFNERLKMIMQKKTESV